MGLDTNVIVRYVTQDDPVNSPRATKFIENHLTSTNKGYVSVVALVETVWVLDTSYGFSDRQIAHLIQELLGSESVVVEDAPEVSVALMAMKRGLGDFTDVLLAAKCARAGCVHTVTFDRKAQRIRGFVAIP